MSEEEKRSTELTTWQEIARYLGVSTRTAQFWEEEKGLPVRRLAERSRVFAYREEIDKWKCVGSA